MRRATEQLRGGSASSAVQTGRDLKLATCGRSSYYSAITGRVHQKATKDRRSIEVLVDPKHLPEATLTSDSIGQNHRAVVLGREPLKVPGGRLLDMSPIADELLQSSETTLCANLKLSRSLKKGVGSGQAGARLIRGRSPGRSPRSEARCLAPGPAPRLRRRSGHNGSRG
jgi:hypothetical protein